MPEYIALSQNIKKIRKEMDKTQNEFAAACGISADCLSLIEREKTDPKLSTIQKIAAYAGREVAELISLKDSGVWQ